MQLPKKPAETPRDESQKENPKSTPREQNEINSSKVCPSASGINASELIDENSKMDKTNAEPDISKQYTILAESTVQPDLPDLSNIKQISKSVTGELVHLPSAPVAGSPKKRNSKIKIGPNFMNLIPQIELYKGQL